MQESGSKHSIEVKRATEIQSGQQNVTHAVSSLVDSNYDEGFEVDIGYIPKTIINIVNFYYYTIYALNEEAKFSFRTATTGYYGPNHVIMVVASGVPYPQFQHSHNVWAIQWVAEQAHKTYDYQELVGKILVASPSGRSDKPTIGSISFRRPLPIDQADASRTSDETAVATLPNGLAITGNSGSDNYTIELGASPMKIDAQFKNNGQRFQSPDILITCARALARLAEHGIYDIVDEAGWQFHDRDTDIIITMHHDPQRKKIVAWTDIIGTVTAVSLNMIEKKTFVEIVGQFFKYNKKGGEKIVYGSIDFEKYVAGAQVADLAVE